MSKFHHIQEEMALRWEISHNLDSYPQIEIFAVQDGKDTPKRIQPVMLEYIDTNLVHISFQQQQKGFAFLS